MLELLTNILETLKKTYNQEKRNIATGNLPELIRRKKMKAVESAFSYSNIEGYKKAYENGDVSYALKELTEEYKLSNEAVKYYNDIFYAIYETLKGFVALNEEQVKALDTFRNVLNQLEKDLFNVTQNKRDDLNVDKVLIERLTLLVENLEKGKEEILVEDFEVISQALANPAFHYELKKKVYIGVKKLNDSKPQKTPLELEEILSLFKDHKYPHISSDFTAEEEFEIYRVSDNDKIRRILDFFENKGILNRFLIKNLITILLYGDEEFIKNIYFEMSRDINTDKDFYYLPSIWIRRDIYTDSSDFIRRNENEKQIESPLYDKTKGPSYIETKENVAFLLKNGYDFKTDKGSILKTWNNVLTYNFDYARMVGLKPQNMSFQLESKDFCDLLDGYIESEDLSDICEDFPLDLYELKEKFLLSLWTSKHQNKDGYRNEIYSLLNGKRTINENFLNKLKEKSLQELEGESQSVGMIYPITPNKDLYDITLKDAGLLKIEDDCYNYDYIRNLDSKNMVDPINYVFGSNRTGVQIISRPKVLRIFGALMKSGVVEDEKEALLYALTHNTILDKESYELIKDSIGYTDKKSFTY